MKDDEAESRKQIEQAFADAGLKVPALQEVLAGLQDRPVSRAEDCDSAAAGTTLGKDL